VYTAGSGEDGGVNYASGATYEFVARSTGQEYVGRAEQNLAPSPEECSTMSLTLTLAAFIPTGVSRPHSTGEGAPSLTRLPSAEKEKPLEASTRWRTRGASKKIRQRPTLPRGFPRSTIGSGGLNFRVRDGNGCDPSDIATGKWVRTYEG
jgi:hypothetical protein